MLHTAKVPLPQQEQSGVQISCPRTRHEGSWDSSYNYTAAFVFLFFLRVGKETQRSPFPINGSFKVVLSTQFVSAYIVYTVLVCLTKCKDVKKQPHNIWSIKWHKMKKLKVQLPQSCTWVNVLGHNLPQHTSHLTQWYELHQDITRWRCLLPDGVSEVSWRIQGGEY